MRKLRLLLLMLLLSTVASAQGLFTYMNLSTNFFETLNSGKYEDAKTFFDESLKEKVTAKALEAAWLQIHNQLGDFQSVDGAQNRSQDDFQSVILDCRFKNGSQPFQFVFNNQQKLLGFFIAPKSSVASYKLPAYTDTTSYTEKFITIKSGSHELPGAITIPKTGSNFPVVILVHGSGPADMDETIGANKPFKDIAIGLANKGIATIRYVKRTTLYPSEFQKAFTLKEEVEEDAFAAIEYAKAVDALDSKQIYLFGHSLGGMIAPKLATNSPDLKGVILAAAPARPFAEIAIEQNNYMLQKSGDTTQVTKQAVLDNIKELKRAAQIKAGGLSPDSVVLSLPASYWADINSINAIALSKKLKNKILIIQGGNDFQTTETDFNLWKNSLKGKKNVTLKLYPMLNHLFSFVSEKGTVNQYQQPGNVDEVLINDLATWIKL